MSLIVYVSERFPHQGETFLEDELEALCARGARVVVFPAMAFWRRRQQQASYEIASLGRVEALIRASRTMIRSPRTSASLLRLASARSASSTSWLVRLFGVLVGAALADALQSKRYSGGRHIHGYWANTASTVAWSASTFLNCAFSFTAHRYDVARPELLTTKVSAATGIRFVSEATLQLALSNAPDCGESLRRRGVVLGLFCAPPGSAPPPNATHLNDVSLLVVANLVPVKGHHVLFEAASLLRARSGVRVSITMAGDGALRESLENLARELGLDVVFLGRRDRASVLRLMTSGDYDALALPSLVLDNGLQEGRPYCIIEAMASGLPAIFTTSGGSRELLDEYSLGEIAPGDSEALAAAIERIRDPDLRNLLSAEGLRLSSGQHGERCLDQLVTSVFRLPFTSRM